jgi:hypothetical protein
MSNLCWRVALVAQCVTHDEATVGHWLIGLEAVTPSASGWKENLFRTTMSVTIGAVGWQ